MLNPWEALANFINSKNLPPQPLSQGVDLALHVHNAVNTLQKRVTPPQVTVMEAMNGFIVSKMVFLLCEFRIPDLLHAGPLTIDQLSSQTGIAAPNLKRLLDFAVSREFLRAAGKEQYANNPASEILREDHPHTMYHLILFMGGGFYQDLWNGMPDALRENKNPSELLHKMSYYDWLQANPSVQRLFDEAMMEQVNLSGPMILKHLDLAHGSRICDVGGGNGLLLTNILLEYPHLSGILLDREGNMEAARQLISELHLEDRMEAVSGNFFESVPADCNVYMMRAILHNYDEEECLKILANIRAAMPSDGRLITIEKYMPRHRRDHPVRALDFNLMVTHLGSRERTADEYEQLMLKAGFGKRRDIPLHTLDNIVELFPL